MILSDTIKNRINELGIKQKDIAEELSVSPGMVSQVYNGESMFSRENLVKLNAILKFEDNYLVRLFEKEEEIKAKHINQSDMENAKNWEKEYFRLEKYCRRLEELLDYKDEELKEVKKPGRSTGS